MAINLTNGEEYTLAKIAGTAAVIDGTDHAHAKKVLRNQLHITSSRNTTGVLLLENSHNVTLGPLIRLKNTNAGTNADIYINTFSDNNYWSFGYHASDDKFCINGTTGFASSNANTFELDPNGNLRIDESGSFTCLRVRSGSGTGQYGHNYWDPSDSSQGMQVYNDATYVAAFVNHGGDTSFSRAALFRAGGDSTVSGTNTLIKFADLNNESLGFISFNGNTVTYGAFTGVHYANILQADSVSSTIIESDHTSPMISSSIYPPGTIVSIVKSNIPSGGTQAIHYVVSSSIHQDKRVFGVYESAFDADIDSGELQHQHQIGSLGDHYILVCDQAGNIENGDYITTASGSGGYGCKQSDDIFHNYTVAKSLENVDWSTESDNTKLISCTLHCG